MTVEVMTTNSKLYTGKYNGRWLIRAVQHKMDRQSFQSNLMLARPDGKMPVTTAGYTPFWQTAAKSRPTLTLSGTMSLSTPVGTIGMRPTNIDHMPVITAAADAGVWISSWSNSTVRSVA